MMPQRYTPPQQLHLYVRRVQELRERRLYKSGGLRSVKFEMNFNSNTGTTFSFTEIDEEDLRSFLMSFRLFVMKSEPTYLDTIFTLCATLLKSDALIESFDAAQAHWRKIYRGSTDSFLYEGEKEVRPLEDVLSLWLDGQYFHSDSDKAQRLENWGDFQPVLRSEFIALVQELTQLIIWLGDYIEIGLKNDWFQFAETDN